MSGRLRIAAAVLTLGVAGCAVLLGIEDRAVVEGTVVPAEAGIDRCAHTQPPAAPDVDDDPDTQAQYVVAARGIDIAPSANGVLGFDLDATCTCDPTPSAHDAGPSCTSTVSRNCDQEGGTGIDNAFAQLTYVKALSGTVFGAGSAADGNCGRSALLAVIGKYNGRANDKDVTFAFVLSSGLQTPHEAGEVPSSCNNVGGPQPTVYVPRGDGTDQWSTDTSFVVSKTLHPSQLLNGYVRDWVLVARASEGVPIRVPFGPFIGDARAAIVRASLAIADGGVQIIDGELAARLTSSSVIQGIASVPLGGKAGYICPNNANAALFKSAVDSICSGRDILSDPVQDFTGVACDSVSSAVRFSGDPAQMLEPEAPVDAGVSDCPGVDASCE